MFLSLIARAFGVTGARSRVPESTRRAKAEDTATIPVATSSPLVSLLSPLFHFARLPLIIPSGLDLLSWLALQPTHTRHGGNGEGSGGAPWPTLMPRYNSIYYRLSIASTINTYVQWVVKRSPSPGNRPWPNGEQETIPGRALRRPPEG